MRNYIIKRLLLFVPTLLGVTLMIFLIMRVVPGDVAATILMGPDQNAVFTEEQRRNLEEELGLDKPLPVQYITWVWGLVRLDLGKSWETKIPIARSLKAQFPVTMQLALFAALLVALVGIPIGVFAAVNQDRWPDYILRTIAIMGLAMPTFFVALIVILVLSREFHWIPPLGFVSIWKDPITSFQQLFIPASVLALSSSGGLLRITRGQMLEVMRDDYVRTARAKGLSEPVVIMRHALRNALLPVITVFGFLVAALMGGTVIIELIFSIPGIGQGYVNAVFLKDLSVVQTYTTYFAIVALTVNLLVDLTYAWLDPRIQYS